jgi:cellulose synthase/poly-beta-1,6-N-acetylglucosamine synthase-like glycosyltransferase
MMMMMMKLMVMMMMTFSSSVLYSQVWQNLYRPAKRLRDLGVPPAQWPSVDVLIPCYREPVSVRGPFITIST